MSVPKPWQNPQSGDRAVTSSGRWREVRSVSPTGIVTYSTSGGIQSCGLRRWAEWCNQSAVRYLRAGVDLLAAAGSTEVRR